MSDVLPAEKIRLHGRGENENMSDGDRFDVTHSQNSKHLCEKDDNILL